MNSKLAELEAEMERLEKIAEERKNALFRCIERRDAAEAKVERLRNILSGIKERDERNRQRGQPI